MDVIPGQLEKANGVRPVPLALPVVGSKIGVPVVEKFPPLSSVGGSDNSSADDPMKGPPTSLESVVSRLKK